MKEIQAVVKLCEEIIDGLKRYSAEDSVDTKIVKDLFETVIEFKNFKRQYAIE